MPTQLSTPNLFSTKNLVFQDAFSGSALNAATWNTYMTSNSTQGGAWDSNGLGGSGVGGIYDADYDVPYEVTVNNGLTLNAVQQSVLGANYINGAVTPQTFPVAAGVVDTYGKMEFDGGYLQISMKEPGGDGSWPSLWLLPGAGAGNVGNNFEIDIQEGGFSDGSANPNDVLAYHLHTSAGVFGGVIDTGVDLTASYNTYAINWIPGKSITWYLNGNAVAEITSAQAPIPDEPMELIMNNQVATSAASSWRTSLDGSTPQSMPMQVAGVQLYQTAGSGETITGANVSASTPQTQPTQSTPAQSAPTVTISTAGAVTAQAAQTIGGTVDVADAGSTVLLYDGGSQIGTASVAANGQWSTSVTLVQGLNVLTAADTNAAGTGTAAAVNFTLQTAAPTVAISTAASTVTQANQTIAGTVDIADAGSTVTLYDGSTNIGAASVAANGQWSTSVTLSNRGLNVLTASDANVAGTGTSSAVDLTWQNAAPTVAISTAAGTVTQANQTIAGTVDVADAGTTVTVYDGTRKIGAASVAANGQWSTGVTLANQGVNVLTASDTNASGTGKSAAVNLTYAPAATPSLSVSAVAAISNNGNGQTYSLGNQDYQITLSGYSNRITAGDGVDSVSAGAGQEHVSLGNGDDHVVINGYWNTVTAGNGNDAVSGGQGAETVKLGDGANSVSLSGYYNTVSVGAGANVISAGSGNDTVIAGGGADTISLSGYYNTVQLGPGDDVVNGGSGGDNITLTGGTATLNLQGYGEHVTLGGGVNADLYDLGAALRVDVASSYGADVISGFAQDHSGVIDLLNGAGGYTSIGQILGALQNDGHGGSLLSLGSTGSIDILGVAPSHLTAGNFGF